MRRVQDSTIQLLVMAGLTVVGLACNTEANAACTGVTNTCYGTGALVSITSGVDNSGFGYGAMRYNTIGRQNTASGFQALMYNTTGDGNTASGYGALRFNTAGLYNTAIGLVALERNTTGSVNTAIGGNALRLNTTGSQNTAIGGYALWSNTTGVANAASGAAALFSNTTGAYNAASGAEALFSNTTGNNNTASGTLALRANTTGSQNTAIGHRALFLNTVGFRNVALGYQAGYAVTGSDNIILGGGNQGVAADNGVIRIGASAYQKRAFMAGIRGVKTGATGAVAVLIDSKGQLGTINSSRRFKEDIQPMGSVSERLFALRPVTFRYKQAYEDGSKPVQYGLVAEEVAEVFPELVVHGKDGKPETVAYHVLATLLLNELQKEHRVVEALRQDDEVQAARMAALEQQVAVLAQAVERAGKSRVVASTR